jgi:hypothetical protein
MVTLEIDGRRFPNQKFWITETGHDVFIGMEWLAKQRVLLDCHGRGMVWPDDLPALAKYSPAIQLPPRCLSDGLIDPDIQKDANRRDAKLEKAHKQYQILRRSWRKDTSDIGPTNSQPVQAAKGPQATAPLSAVEVTEDKAIISEIALKLEAAPRRERWERLPLPKEAAVPSVMEAVDDEAIISALATRLEADPRRKRWGNLPLPKDVIQFDSFDSSHLDTNTTTLAALGSSKTFDGKRIPFPDDEDPDHVQLVRDRIPKALAHLEGFFSKKEANTLPPHRPEHDVVLELEKPLPATGPPSYRTPVQFLPLEKETTDKLLKLGFIERCMRADAAPVLFVPKPHSSDRRFCIDYRWRNQFLKNRLVPAPDLNGTVFNCRNARRFSKIDIIQAFHRLRIAVGSEYLTAFRTRQGTFQWKVLPFGLKVGPAWWQQFINSQLHELLDFCASAYADDVLIYSDEDEQEHWKYCEEVIYRLHKADLQGDIKKSRFNVSKVDYLGIVMEAGVGISIDPAKIKAISEWKFEDLTSRTAIRSFIGLCNYVRMFTHHASGIAEPLNRLLKKDTPFEMGPEQRTAFDKMRQLACEAPVLAFFKPGRPTRVETDASRNATGGVIWQQQEDDAWKPVGYASKTMTPAERAYPIQDRELLAVVQTLEHFCPELQGQKFFVVTDHQALLYFSTKRLLSTRQVRWADFLSNFDITFQYRPGKENIAADALSRKTVNLPTVKAREQEERTMALIPKERLLPQNTAQPAEQVETVSDHKMIAATDPADHTDIPQGADLVDLIKNENQAQGLGTKDKRLWVPEKTADGRIYLQTALIREAHVPKIFAHPGQNKVIKMLEREYYWPQLKQSVRRYIRNCHECRRNKIPRDKTPGLLHPLPVPGEVWEHIVVDGKTMPKDRFGYDYVWGFVCKLSRLLATLPGKKTDTAEILATRYYRYLYRFLGLPTIWISDNAGPFVSAFLAKLNELTGTKHRHSSAYHPQTQGAIEFTNQELDQRLRFYVDKYQDDWSIHLPALDFAHNSSWHSAINMSPLKVMLGKDIRNPLSLDLSTAGEIAGPAERALELVRETKEVQELARRAAAETQEKQRIQANKKRRPVDFKVHDEVFLRKKGFSTQAPTTRLDSQSVGPFEVLEVRGHSYVLDLPASYKMPNLFHADRLRKADDDPLPQQVPTPPPPEEINGEPEFEVERIERSRLHGRSRELQYQVAWRGCDPDDTWYPAENFKNAGVALETFHQEHPEAPGPPLRLQDWIRAAAADEVDDDHPDDNRAARTAKQSRLRRHT